MSVKSKVKAPYFQAYFKPPKLSSQRVWCGLYGTQFGDVIVFFKHKPVLCDRKEWNNLQPRGFYDRNDNRAEIIGRMEYGQFKEYFRLDIGKAPKGGEITSVVLVRLTAPFNKDGELYSIDFNFDN